MEILGSSTLLLQNVDDEKQFQVIKEHLLHSVDETEISQAVNISFKICFQKYDLDEVEENIFQYACPAVRRVFLQKLQNLEKSKELSSNEVNPPYYLLLENSEFLNSFCDLFSKLNNFQKVTASHIKSLLMNSFEMLISSYQHCSKSEEIYGVHFQFMTEYLTSFFKKCCELLDILLNFLTEKITYMLENNDENEIFNKILICLPNCGLALMNLDVKNMAKVWKTHISLIEKYFMFIKENFDIGKTINCLCEIIISSTENIFCIHNIEECNRSIKLSCFNLKLVIKFCELFEGYLFNCHKSLLSLLLRLSSCIISLSEEKQSSINKDLLKQLTIGIDPLLTQLIFDEKLVKECRATIYNLLQSNHKPVTFAVLFCSLLKKLLSQKSNARILWFNEENNILNWLFLCISCNEYEFCSSNQFQNILVGGKQRKFSDLYEYVLAVSTAFILTSNTTTFFLVEKTLIRNVLQSKPLVSLLAIDIWCLVARFGDSNLCFSQLLKLIKLFEEFQNASGIQKWYLALLIERLFPLLAESQKKMFLNSIHLQCSSKLWKMKYFTEDNSLFLTQNINNSFLYEIEKFIFEDNSLQLDCDSLLEEKNKSQQTFEMQFIELWKFNCSEMQNCMLKENFLNIACLMTVYAIPHISSENMSKVLFQIKELVKRQSPVTDLHFIEILNAASVINFPSDDFQRNIIESISEIFGSLLSSNNVVVKQKALEKFCSFSHVTSHTEIITLSVCRSNSLKVEIANYLQKQCSYPQLQLELNDYFIKLSQNKFQCVCNSEKKIVKNTFENFSDSVSIDEIFVNWKKIAELLKYSLAEFTSSQREEIKNICVSLLNSFQ